ncbi:MAG: ABC transporter permease, partial [Terriglobia bacterium]
FGGTVLALGQGLIFVLLAPLVVEIALSPGQVLLVAAVLLLVALAVTSLGFSVAWQFDSVQGFHGVVNLFLIPMWVLSGALFPPSGAADWIRWMMKLNPLTYAMAALRRTLALSPGSDVPSLSVALVVVSLFAGLTLLTAIRFASRPLHRTLG